MRRERLSPVKDLKIEKFSAGVITEVDSHVINGIFSKKPDDTWFITQRPAVNIVEDCSATVSDVRGRGIYYWALAGALYFVNDAEVYKGNYGAPVREAEKSVNTLTSSGTTASATITSHGYAATDTVLFAGAVETDYNGRFLLASVTPPDDLTYTLANSTTSPATGTITARRVFNGGSERVYIFELETYLVILDPQNNEGWYITSVADTVLNKITDTNFPTDLERGGMILNGRLYVIGNDGTLYASNEGDPTTWGALDIADANYGPDAALMAELHSGDVAVFGANTIEYFYDAGNATGSPLSRRTDIVHEIGVASEDTLWTDNDATFFVGMSRTGGLSVYLMAGYRIEEVSTPEIDSFLTTAYLNESKKFHACGANVGGKIFYMLTVYHLDVDSNPESLTTLVFNAKTKTWTLWELMHDGIDDCPVVAWTLTTDSNITKGILTNGDIVTFQDDLMPQDLTLAFGVYESGVYEPGIYVESGGSGTAISLEIITGSKTYRSTNRKRMDSCRMVGNRTDASQTFTLSVSDEVNNNYSSVGTFDLANARERITRMGSFSQRNLKLTGAPTERVVIEALEVEYRELRS